MTKARISVFVYRIATGILALVVVEILAADWMRYGTPLK